MDIEKKDGKVISIINMKGGVGKTTLTKEIGVHLSVKKSMKVLLIDVDPQLNLTQSLFRTFGFAQSEEIAADMELANEDIDGEVINDEQLNKPTKLDISKASIERIFSSTTASPAKISETIQPLSKNLSIIPGELGIEFSLRNLNSGKLENGIHDFISKNKLREQFDFILIDCPPTYSSYTVAALKPSDFFIVPVKPEAYSILGLDMLLNVVESVIDESDVYFKDKPLKNIGIVFTDIPSSISRGTEKMLQSIKSSKSIVSRDTFIFSTYFKTNPYIKQRIDYVIDFNNSVTSKNNLEVLVDELLERIDSEWKKN